jgi:hypothetical protein
MGLEHSPSIVMNGLVLALDAANSRCYSGSGLTVYNLSGGIGGTLLGGVGFTTANNGGLLFSANQYILIPTIIDTNSDFTISFWNRRSAVNTIHTLLTGFTLNSYLQIRYNTSNLVQLVKSSVADVGSFSGFTSTAGVDVYLSIRLTKSSNTYDLFVNGSYISSIVSAQTYLTLNSIIGGTSTESFIGNIYSATYYNRALTAAEVRQNYNATKKRYGL